MSGLRLTNSTTTITLHDPSIGVQGMVSYVPTTPQATSAEAIDALSDGGDMPITTYRNVSERAVIDLPTNASTIFQNIARLAQDAREWQRSRRGDRAWLEFRLTDSGSWWRSELFHAEASLTDGALNVGRMPTDSDTIELYVTRRHFWEGPENYLTLTNTHGTSSAGVTVLNGNDGSRNNFVTITSTIDGSLPAPCRIEYTNSYNVGTATADLSIGSAVYRAPTASTMVLEPTSAGGFTVYIVDTLTTDSNSNGGSYRSWTWTGSGERQLGYWALPSTLLTALQGAYVRPMVRLSSTPESNLYARLVIKIGTVSPLWVGAWVKLTSGLLNELPAMPLPPYLASLGASLASLNLFLEVRSAGTGSHSFGLDCIHLLPTESYRKLRQEGYGVAYNARLVDDQIGGLVYSDGWAGGALGNYSAIGQPIMLVPGRTNRLHFLATSQTGGSEAARSGSVRIAYRPRRMVL